MVDFTVMIVTHTIKAPKFLDWLLGNPTKIVIEVSPGFETNQPKLVVFDRGYPYDTSPSTRCSDLTSCIDFSYTYKRPEHGFRQPISFELGDPEQS